MNEEKITDILARLNSTDLEIKKHVLLDLTKENRENRFLHLGQRELIDGLIPSLMALVQDEDVEIKTLAMNLLFVLANSSLERKKIISAIIPQLSQLIKHENGQIRIVSIALLSQFSRGVQSLADEINSTIPSLFEFLKDADYVNKIRTLRLLFNLLRTNRVQPDQIRPVIPQLIELVKHKDFLIKCQSVLLLSEHLLGRIEDLAIIRGIIPELLKCIRSPDYLIKSGVISLLFQCVKGNKAVINSIGEDIIHLLPLLKHEDTKTKKQVLWLLSQVDPENIFQQDALIQAIPQLIELLKHTDEEIVGQAIKLLHQLVLGRLLGNIYETFSPAMPQLIELLKCTDTAIVSNAIWLLTQLFANNTECIALLRSTMPQLIELFKQADMGIISSALWLMIQYVKSSTLAILPLREVIPQLLELLQKDHFIVIQNTIWLLSKLAKENEADLEAIIPAIPDLLLLAHHSLPGNKSQAISLLCQLAQGNTSCHDTISPSIPKLIKFISYSHNGLKAQSIMLLAHLGKENKAHLATINTIIPQLIELLNHERVKVRRSAAFGLTIFAGYSETRDKISPSIHSLIELLGSTDGLTSRHAIHTLACLANEKEAQKQFAPAIEPMIQLLSSSKDEETQKFLFIALQNLSFADNTLSLFIPAIHKLMESLHDNHVENIRNSIVILVTLSQIKGLHRNQNFLNSIPRLIELALGNDFDIVIKRQAASVLANFSVGYEKIKKMVFNYSDKLIPLLKVGDSQIKKHVETILAAHAKDNQGRAIRDVSISATQSIAHIPGEKNLLPIGINKKYINQVVEGYENCVRIVPGSDKPLIETKLDDILRFQELNKFAGDLQGDGEFLSIRSEDYALKLHQNGLNDTSLRQHYFIFAGRGLNAYVPLMCAGMLPILVMTTAELAQANQARNIPPHCQILEICHLSGFTPNLIAARRLAAFICGKTLALANLWIADDNIQSIHFNSQFGQFKQLAEHLLQANLLSSGISTIQAYAKRSASETMVRRMGDKVLCVNMHKIIELLGERPCHELVFPPNLEKGMGTDLFFQCYLESLQQGYGYGVFPKDWVMLERSKSNQNQHLTHTFELTGKPALQTTVEFDPFSLKDELYSFHYKQTLQNLIKELEQRIAAAREELKVYQAKNIYLEHFALNKSLTSLRDDNLSILYPPDDARPVNEAAWRTYVLDVLTQTHKLAKLQEIFSLRDYQLDAIRAVAKQGLLQKSQVIMATGAGKTLVELVLLVLTRLYYGPDGPSVVLIESNRQLVEQVYSRFLGFASRLHDLRCNMQHILKIMSGSGHLSVKSCHVNKQFESGGFLFFCDESYSKAPVFASPLILLDESHLGNQASQDSAHVFFTATPANSRDLGQLPATIYEVSREQLVRDAYIPPLVVKYLAEVFSQEQTQVVAENIVEHLQTTILPLGGSMAARSGLIYVNSIQDAIKIQAILEKSGFDAKAVHSQLVPAQLKEYIESFVEDAGSKVKILIAVDMLGVGFDTPYVDWIVLLHSAKNPIQVAQQLGRLCRKISGSIKVGFALTFSNINLDLVKLAHPLPEFPQLSFDAGAGQYFHPEFIAQNRVVSPPRLSPLSFFPQVVAPPPPSMLMQALHDNLGNLGRFSRCLIQFAEQLHEWRQSNHKERDLSQLSYQILIYWCLEFASNDVKLNSRLDRIFEASSNWLKRNGYKVNYIEAPDSLVDNINQVLQEEKDKGLNLPDFLLTAKKAEQPELAVVPRTMVMVRDLHESRDDLCKFSQGLSQLAEQLDEWRKANHDCNDLSELSYHTLIFWLLKFASQHHALPEIQTTLLTMSEDWLLSKGYTLKHCDSVSRLFASIYAKIDEQKNKLRRVPEFLIDDADKTNLYFKGKRSAEAVAVENHPKLQKCGEKPLDLSMGCFSN